MGESWDAEQGRERASRATLRIDFADEMRESETVDSASSSAEPGGNALRQVHERYVEMASSASRFGAPGRLLKRALLRLLRFYTRHQQEFNEAAVAALDSVRAEVANLRAQEAAARERHQQEFNEAAVAALDSVRAEVANLRAQEAAARERLEGNVLAQGRHLDDVTGQLVHFTKAVTAAQADARDVGAQVPRLAEDLRARISALERDLRPAISLDHFDFARRFRGDESRIQERMRQYARMFGAVRRVVDLGCGRGEFVRACAEIGVSAYGIDSDPDMVSHCELQGLEVGRGDIFAHLSSLEDRSLDGVFSAQVIEHLTPPQIADLVQLAADKLKRGALFVAETIDPNTFSALRWYYLDLTHRQPVPSETLSYLLERAGFAVRDVLQLSPLEESEQLAHLPEPGEGEDPAGLVATYNRNVDRLNRVLFGTQDYAIIAER